MFDILKMGTGTFISYFDKHYLDMLDKAVTVMHVEKGKEKDIDIESWAKKLAEDLSKFKD